MEPSILGSVDGIWAVSKPSGLRVHPANDDGAPDLIAWLASRPELPPSLVPVPWVSTVCLLPASVPVMASLTTSC